MFEKDLPGGRTADFNKDSEIGDLPLETCETMNGSWGFNLTDRRYKSTRDLIRYLVRAAGSNANFLLNVGPMPNGRIQPEFVTRLQEIGAWMAKNGEAIYGTRGGPIAPQPWGVTTRKGSRVYVHVLDAPDTALLLPPLGAKDSQRPFPRHRTRGGVLRARFRRRGEAPRDAVDPIDTSSSWCSVLDVANLDVPERPDRRGPAARCGRAARGVVRVVLELALPKKCFSSVRLDRRPRHLLGVPADRPVLEVAVVRQQRGTGRAQPEHGIFDHRPARAHRVEEVAEMIVGAVVPRRRRIGLVAARLQLRPIRDTSRDTPS